MLTIRVTITSLEQITYLEAYYEEEYANKHPDGQLNQQNERGDDYGIQDNTNNNSYPQIPYQNNQSQYYQQQEQQSSINALPPLFTNDQLDRELFAMFDIHMQGFIDSRDLETIGRAMGWKTDQSNLCTFF